MHTFHGQRRGRVCKGIAVALLAVVVPYAGIAGGAGEALRPPEALQSLWNESMLDGQSRSYYDGKEIGAGSAPCPRYGDWVWVHEVANTGCGLRVVDLRERRWLKSRGGWVIEGGLLGKREVDGRQIELYGKVLVRHEPYLEPWPHVWIGNKAWNASHEFFLIRRNKDAERAVTLRSWSLPDPAASGGYSIVARGRLECESACEKVRVHIMHAHDRDLVAERVDVSSISRR